MGKQHRRQAASAKTSATGIRTTQVSQKGAVMYVERVELSADAKRSLSTEVDKIESVDPSKKSEDTKKNRDNSDRADS